VCAFLSLYPRDVPRYATFTVKRERRDPLVKASARGRHVRACTIGSTFLNLSRSYHFAIAPIHSAFFTRNRIGNAEATAISLMFSPTCSP
jgi:hypothetical protein